MGWWSTDEDNLLRKLVADATAAAPGESITWVKIAESLEKRNDNACRQRWVNVLDPSIVKGPFTRQEEEILLREHIIHGNKWSTIVKSLPGRPVNNVKIWYNSRHNKKGEAKPEKTEGQIEAALSLYRSKEAKTEKQLEEARSKAAKAEKQLEEEEAGDDPPLSPQIDPPLQPPQFVLPLKARMKMDHMEIGWNPPAPAVKKKVFHITICKLCLYV
ncbi:hypothetical protein SASPL_115887 [Salvia splendens]|uniref:Myb proto-oncogene protein, plant n=1 Tax=Salvia splendens TaxID=180675 RepID=A0A8X8Y7F0_SALSN|nr:hypothetical protein SASPL_115887 [Salvia splendens]